MASEVIVGSGRDISKLTFKIKHLFFLSVRLIEEGQGEGGDLDGTPLPQTFRL